MKRLRLSFIALSVFCCASAWAEKKLTNEQILGSLLFQDANLSWNRNQSCSSCHTLTPIAKMGKPFNRVPGFVDPGNVKNGTAVSTGSFVERHGILNAPSAGYAAYSPLFHWDDSEGLYVGGQFWNGRATNLTGQAKQPFLNPVEMAMPNKWSVVSRLRENQVYRKLFRDIYAIDLTAVDFYPKPPSEPVKNPAAVENIYHHLAKAIGEFEKTRSSINSMLNSIALLPGKPLSRQSRKKVSTCLTMSTKAIALLVISVRREKT